eukprot:6180182-Pleurochrysis_carterae.AAC.2
MVQSTCCLSKLWLPYCFAVMFRQAHRPKRRTDGPGRLLTTAPVATAPLLAMHALRVLAVDTSAPPSLLPTLPQPDTHAHADADAQDAHAHTLSRAHSHSHRRSPSELSPGARSPSRTRSPLRSPSHAMLRSTSLAPLPTQSRASALTPTSRPLGPTPRWKHGVRAVSSNGADGYDVPLLKALPMTVGGGQK